jgi:hypothetical protein
MYKLVREKQKGKKCSVDGCVDWCYAHNLCKNHSMALRRYGNVGGAKAGHRKGVCYCGKEFIIKKSDQVYCSDKCYRNTPAAKASLYAAVKRYRASNIKKSRARDIVSKSINREGSMKRESCLVCGSVNAEMHHYNYSNAREVVPLCKPHHGDLHSWDAN